LSLPAAGSTKHRWTKLWSDGGKSPAGTAAAGSGFFTSATWRRETQNVSLHTLMVHVDEQQQMGQPWEASCWLHNKSHEKHVKAANKGVLTFVYAGCITTGFFLGTLGLMSAGLTGSSPLLIGLKLPFGITLYPGVAAAAFMWLHTIKTNIQYKPTNQPSTTALLDSHVLLTIKKAWVTECPNNRPHPNQGRIDFGMFWHMETGSTLSVVWHKMQRLESELPQLAVVRVLVEQQAAAVQRWEPMVQH